MLLKLNTIIIYSIISFFLAIIIYPLYIKFLQKRKMGKQIREDAVTGGKAEIFAKLHGHKSGTPTMGGGIFIIVVLVMVIGSYILQHFGLINNTLFSRQETYIILFAFFSMGLIGLADDYFNIKGTSKVKGLSAKVKLLWMFIFSAFISYWLYDRLGVSTVNFWPFRGTIDIGIWLPILTFFFTIAIVNAINITDGLDGLVGGLMMFILGVFAIVTFIYGQYLTTTIIAIVLGAMSAFLHYNINPAKIFMGDSGSLALGGLVASLVYLINKMGLGILIPFMIMFAIFWVDFGSSALQMFWKKFFKRKLFPIAPFHHYLEYKGMAEFTIVMRFRLVQGLLASVALIMIFYQLNLG